ncbi:MAG TPA: tetratricopeptide repeat protein, partial [Nannocystaceae bacterium]|nr:tetratricopeptide repeat protein [Nannocystaceae bacterium]
DAARASEPATLGPGPPTQEPASPAAIGRFKVLDRLGGGGMGVVYSAWDPELERRVAIKLLRPELQSDGGSVGPARLQREAQAMARISHPNVIAVHEVGTLASQVYVAMEFIEGQTLGQWLSERRTWREILACFLAAGSGIAAAHAAGVVHRDFKPDNVLVSTPEGGRDGIRVRVLDFGLARAGGAAAIAQGELPDKPSEVITGQLDQLGTPLTRTGAVMGTPAYMSPEQWIGRPADERSDQFSFCVALFEALHGRRPFTGATLQELATAVVKGVQIEAPKSGEVPRFLETALRRGLSRDPESRFASMNELLDALRRDPSRTWRRVGAGLAVAVVASGITALAVGGNQPGDACDSVGDRLGGVWDDARRTAVRDAMLATAAPFAERTWETTSRLLDAYAQRWIEHATEACAAVAVAGVASDTSRRRELCLGARRAELGALVDRFAEADKGITIQAVDAAARLPDLDDCADEKRLAAWKAREDPTALQLASEARAQLARASALGAVGRYEPAIAAAQEVVDVAGELDDPALEASALLVRGQYEERKGERDKGEESLRRAVELAELADDHGTRAQALTQLVFMLGQTRDGAPRALALGNEAATVLRVIDADPVLRAQLDNAMGVASKSADRLGDAVEHQRRALATLEELYGDEHPATLRTMGNLANTLRQLEHFEESEQLLRRATDGLERTLGTDHPAYEVSLSGLAIVIAATHDGREQEAIQLLRRALALRERNDPEPRAMARAQFNLARALYDAREYDEALTEYRAALERRKQAPATDQDLVAFWAGIGACELRLGHVDAARAEFERWLAVEQKVGRKGALAEARFELARTLIATDPERAVELGEQAAWTIIPGVLQPEPKRPALELMWAIHTWLPIARSVVALKQAAAK